MHEEWRPVLGFEDTYLVSDFGRVMRIKATVSTGAGRILKPSLATSGYYHVNLCAGKERHKAVTIHKLVAEAFYGPRPDGADIDHKDGNPENNRADNLEYVSRSENVKRGYRRQRKRGIVRKGLRGEDNPLSKLSATGVRKIKTLLRRGKTHREIAKQFGVCRATISFIAEGKRWAHI